MHVPHLAAVAASTYPSPGAVPKNISPRMGQKSARARADLARA